MTRLRCAILCIIFYHISAHISVYIASHCVAVFHIASYRIMSLRTHNGLQTRL